MCVYIYIYLSVCLSSLKHQILIRPFMNKKYLARQKLGGRREFQAVLQSHPLYFGGEQNIKSGSNTLRGEWGGGVFLVFNSEKITVWNRDNKNIYWGSTERKRKALWGSCFIIIKMWKTANQLAWNNETERGRKLNNITAWVTHPCSFN